MNSEMIFDIGNKYKNKTIFINKELFTSSNDLLEKYSIYKFIKIENYSRGSFDFCYICLMNCYKVCLYIPYVITEESDIDKVITLLDND